MPLPALFLFLAACSTDPGNTDSSDTAAGGATDSSSLGTCGGEVDDSVPEPFASWFLCSDLTVDGGSLKSHSTSLPPHPSPYYDPDNALWVEFDEQGGDRFQNPNELSEQDMNLTIPLEPIAKGITITTAMVDEQAGTSTEEYRGRFQGLGLDGTALFTGVAAPGDAISEEERTFDQYEGHPTNESVYHHHGANPSALMVLEHLGETTSTTPGSGTVEMFGIMCDGTVVLGCNELDGIAVSASVLDAQGGHVGDIDSPDGESWFEDRYHVHACSALGRHLTPEIQYYEGTCG